MESRCSRSDATGLHQDRTACIAASCLRSSLGIIILKNDRATYNKSDFRFLNFNPYSSGEIAVMITLYKFGPIDDVCDPSPFCVKVEAYCRLAGLPYTTQSGAKYMRSAPKGKLPYIEDSGKTIADSTFIINYLRATYGDTLDAHLSVPEKAIAHAFTKMIDENLYWVLAHARWKPEHNWATLQQLFFQNLPFPLKYLIPFMARKKVFSALYKQGLGRHSDAEILEIGTWDLTALSDLLSDKAYFFGDKPCSFDAIAYAILAQMILTPGFTGPIFDKAQSYENLVEFTRRFHKNYFQEQSSPLNRAG